MFWQFEIDEYNKKIKWSQKFLLILYTVMFGLQKRASAYDG